MSYRHKLKCHIGTNSKPKKSGAEVGAAAGAAAAAAPPRGSFAARGAAEAAAAAAGAAAARPPLRGPLAAGAGAGAGRHGAAAAVRPRRHRKGGGVAVVVAAHAHRARRRPASARWVTVRPAGRRREQRRAHIRCSAEGSSTPSRAAAAEPVDQHAGDAGSSDACAEAEVREACDSRSERLWAAGRRRTTPQSRISASWRPRSID